MVSIFTFSLSNKIIANFGYILWDRLNTYSINTHSQLVDLLPQKEGNIFNNMEAKDVICSFWEWQDCHWAGQGIAQVVEHSHVNLGLSNWACMAGAFAVWAIFPFQPVVYNWSVKGCDISCPACGKVHIKDPLLLIEKSSLCGDSRFPLKKYVTMTICLTSNNW